MFVEKESDITWEKVNEIFWARTFKVDLEYQYVYVNIQKLGLQRIACRYLAFLCAYIVSWILPHANPKTIPLNSDTRQRLASFLVQKYHLMYHLPELKFLMDSYFYVKTKCLNTKDIVKEWVKEPTKFCSTPTNTYKTKYLRSYYHLLIFLCCRIYYQQSTETFPKGPAFLMD